MNISMPERLKAWAERRVSDGRYASTSDYIRDLIRRDESEAAELAWLQTELDRGRGSAMEVRSHDQMFEDIRAKYLAG